MKQDKTNIKTYRIVPEAELQKHYAAFRWKIFQIGINQESIKTLSISEKGEIAYQFKPLFPLLAPQTKAAAQTMAGQILASLSEKLQKLRAPADRKSLQPVELPSDFPDMFAAQHLVLDTLNLMYSENSIYPYAGKEIAAWEAVYYLRFHALDYTEDAMPKYELNGQLSGKYLRMVFVNNVIVELHTNYSPVYPVEEADLRPLKLPVGAIIDSKFFVFYEVNGNRLLPMTWIAATIPMAAKVPLCEGEIESKEKVNDKSIFQPIPGEDYYVKIDRIKHEMIFHLIFCYNKNDAILHNLIGKVPNLWTQNSPIPVEGYDGIKWSLQFEVKFETYEGPKRELKELYKPSDNDFHTNYEVANSNLLDNEISQYKPYPFFFETTHDSKGVGETDKSAFHIDLSAIYNDEFKDYSHELGHCLLNDVNYPWMNILQGFDGTIKMVQDDNIRPKMITKFLLEIDKLYGHIETISTQLKEAYILYFERVFSDPNYDDIPLKIYLEKRNGTVEDSYEHAEYWGQPNDNPMHIKNIKTINHTWPESLDTHKCGYDNAPLMSYIKLDPPAGYPKSKEIWQFEYKHLIQKTLEYVENFKAFAGSNFPNEKTKPEIYMTRKCRWVYWL